MASHRYGYARVSTADQDPQLQIDALQEAQCDRIWVERASGARADRPELADLLDRLRAGDTLVVWRLDRLARSTRHLLEVAEDLQERGIHLASLTESIDSSTPAGRMVLTMLGAVAQMERELVRERTMAGLAAARARGRVGGRRSGRTPQKVAAARALLDAGSTAAEAAAAIGVSRATLFRWLAAEDHAETAAAA